MQFEPRIKSSVEDQRPKLEPRSRTVGSGATKQRQYNSRTPIKRAEWKTLARWHIKVSQMFEIRPLRRRPQYGKSRGHILSAILLIQPALRDAGMALTSRTSADKLHNSSYYHSWAMQNDSHEKFRSLPHHEIIILAPPPRAKTNLIELHLSARSHRHCWCSQQCAQHFKW